MTKKLKNDLFIWYDGPSLAGRKTTIESFLAHHDPTILYSDHDGSWKWTLNYKKQRTIALALGHERSPWNFKDMPWRKEWTTEMEHLKKIDGIVFVVDSHSQLLERNKTALSLLKEKIAHVGRNIASIPLVFQLNQRDLIEKTSIDELKSNLTWPNSDYVPSIAIEERGIRTALLRIIEMIDQVNLDKTS